MIQTPIEERQARAPIGKSWKMGWHIVTYASARFIPGAVNFLALAIYTRWLDTSSYGRYAYVLAVVNLVQIAGFDWLRLGLFRFFQRAQIEERLGSLLSTVVLGFLAICAVTALFWSGAMFILPIDPALRQGLWLGLILVCSQGIYQQVLEWNRSSLAPIRYGLVVSGRAIGCLAFAVTIMAIFGPSERTLLLGLSAGYILPVLLDMPRWLHYIRPRAAQMPLAIDLFKYGLPLTLNYGLFFIISLSDRFLIQHFMGSDAVGLYAAGYDLANQSLNLILVIINLATYPIILRTLEQHGQEAARGELRRHFTYLIALALPAAAGLALLAAPVADLMLGSAFQEAAARIIPWIALAAMLGGIKVYYFDYAFQLSLRTHMQIWSVGCGAILNVVLNLWLIPIFGIDGAVYATVAAQAAALGVSIFLSRYAFTMPFPIGQLGRVLLAVGTMGLALWFLPKSSGLFALITCVAAGGTAYAAMLWVTNVGNIRRAALPVLQGVHLWK